MTRKAQLAIEKSEKRQRANELMLKDELTTEERAELESLTKRLQEIEVELRAAIVLEETNETRTEGTPENREYRTMVGRASLGTIFEAVVEHRQTEGAERELQEHHGLHSNQVPVDLLENRAVTPAPANVGQTQVPIIPGVFAQACAAFLGIDMPRVAVGDAVFPVLTTNAAPGTPAENGPQTETTGAFSADVLSPGRTQTSFFYSREDRARFSGMDSALRENLSMALSDKLDDEILSGTNGLLTGTVLANHNVNAVTMFANYLAKFGYSRADGKYAGTTADLRIVVGAATYAHMGAAYRNNNVDRNAIDRLMEITSGVKVSDHVPAASGNKQNALIRLGMRRDMVAPVWEGLTLIPDEVTKAANGQIVITAVMLYAVKVLRVAGFYKQQTQHRIGNR